MTTNQKDKDKQNNTESAFFLCISLAKRMMVKSLTGGPFKARGMLKNATSQPTYLKKCIPHINIYWKQRRAH